MTQINGTLPNFKAVGALSLETSINKRINSVVVPGVATSATVDFTPKGYAMTYQVNGNSYLPTNGWYVQINTSITFTASTKVDVGVRILDYIWDFGDGTKGFGNPISHTFKYEGSNQVTLCVIDSKNKKTFTRFGIYPKSGSINVAPTVSRTGSGSITGNLATLGATVNGNFASTTMFFEYSTSSSFTSVTATSPQAVTNDGIPHAMSANISGLSGGTTYYIRAKATNANGTTIGGVSSFMTLAAPIAITNNASSITYNGATLSVTGNSNGADNGVLYAQYGTSLSYGNEVPLVDANIDNGGNVTRLYPVTGLNASTLYHFRARVTNNNGTTFGSDATFTTSAPPLGQFVRHVGDNKTSAYVTTLSITVNGNVPAGHSLVIRALSEPYAGTGLFFSASDSQANTYTQDRYQTTSSNVPQHAVLSSKITNPLNTGDTITVTLPTDYPRKCSILVDEFVGNLTSNSVTGNYAFTSAPSMTRTPSNVGDLVIGAIFVQGVVGSFIQDTDTVGGSWNSLPSLPSTVSGISGHYGAYKVVTSTAAQIYNPTFAANQYTTGIMVVYTVT